MFKAIRLQDRMAGWYSGFMLVTLVAFACVVYLMTATVLDEMLRREANLTLQQISAQVENEDGMLTYENEVPLSSGSMYYVMEENGSELASYGEDITLFDSTPIASGAFRRVQGKGQDWLVLDSNVLNVGPYRARVRVAVSCMLSQQVLNTLMWVFLGAIPTLTLAALFGGRLIAKKSLRPIREIIRSADIISSGDLTARVPQAKAMDELGELTQTLNRMLAGVETAFLREKRFTSDASHELRTPVAVLRAYTESLLAETGFTEDQRSSLQTMLGESERMQRIIGQLLTITRGQEGRYPICFEKLHLKSVCDGVVATLADKLTEHDISLSVNMDDTLLVEADQSLLTELFLNLIENAIKYSKPGGRITVAAERREGLVEIVVKDEGIGIPEDALPHIFERFYRVDTVRDRSGTGLGLSIVRWIVDAHIGSIHVESQPGSGTTFRIRLPEKHA